MTMAEHHFDQRQVAKGFPDRLPGPKLPAAPPVSVRQLVLWLIFAGFGLFGGLVVWASVAQMTSAVVAPGSFKVLGDHVRVDHLEGGIVKEILVNEGDVVEKGQVIAVLDDNRVNAQISILNGQLASALASEARLMAELAGSDELTVSAELQALVDNDPELAKHLDSQRSVLKSRNALMVGTYEIMDQRIAQIEDGLVGQREQMAALQEQLDIVQEERANLNALFEKGIVTKTRMDERRRLETGLLGEIGILRSRMEASLKQETELEERILQIQRDQLREVSESRQAVQETIYDIRQRMSVAQDTYNRLEIVAPAAGQVVDLEINTIGQVLDRNHPLLSIVPSTAELVLETQVKTSDIDDVVVGGPARVQLSAYSFRTTPPVKGYVSLVPADATRDATKGISYYTVQVRIPEEELAALPNVKALPGMPAQAMLETGTQTVMNYLLSPLLGAMFTAMREKS